MHTIRSFGPAEADARQQLSRCLAVSGEWAQGVLCADHHKGYSMPIGGVIASKTHIIPAGVGFDIACGNCAVQTNVLAKDIDTAKVMDEIWKRISFGVGRVNDEPVKDHEVFDAIAQSPITAQRTMLRTAQAQLGTVGSGNHYVDLFEDRESGKLWVGVHFGSRGFGHKTAMYFLKLAAESFGDGTYNDSMDSVPDAIPLGAPMADDYMAAMELAGRYAYAGRDWVVNRVLNILQATTEQYVHNHHNFAWWERGVDGDLWCVIRKGATPAAPGQQGFIGGSMGDDAVIVEGVESQTGRETFYSTVHGAGRVMGRRAAAGVYRRGVMVKPGAVNFDAVQVNLKADGIELRGGGADEAPECYKNLNDVLRHHRGTITVLNTLRPIGVAMAGRGTYDPYKD